MAKIHSRCERCKRFASLANVTVYVPPGTLKVARVCAGCESIVRNLNGKLRQMVTKGELCASVQKSDVRSTGSALQADEGVTGTIAG